MPDEVQLLVPGACESCGEAVMAPVPPVLLAEILKPARDRVEGLADRLQIAVYRLEMLKSAAGSMYLRRALQETIDGMVDPWGET